MGPMWGRGCETLSLTLSNDGSLFRCLCHDCCWKGKGNVDRDIKHRLWDPSVFQLSQTVPRFSSTNQSFFERHWLCQLEDAGRNTGPSEAYKMGSHGRSCWLVLLWPEIPFYKLLKDPVNDPDTTDVLMKPVSGDPISSVLFLAADSFMRLSVAVRCLPTGHYWRANRIGHVVCWCCDR